MVGVAILKTVLKIKTPALAITPVIPANILKIKRKQNEKANQKTQLKYIH